ncbi:hypothetical protein ShzoTeo12_43140 (plasmid) [Shinella zoogloeoides]|nr:hypothetical protein ShzoTeo12_43140 [Shinella zoogloeoides]
MAGEHDGALDDAGDEAVPAAGVLTVAANPSCRVFTLLRNGAEPA